MAKKKPAEQGIMAIFFETDLKKTRIQKEENYTPLQKRILHNLSAEEQEKIRAGYGTAIVCLESEQRICEFNMEKHRPPKHAIEALAHDLLPFVQDFFENEENRRKFEEYMRNQERNK